MKFKFENCYLYLSAFALVLLHIVFFPNILNNKDLVLNEISNYLIHQQNYNYPIVEINLKNVQKNRTSISVKQYKCNEFCENNCFKLPAKSIKQFQICLKKCNCEYGTILIYFSKQRTSYSYLCQDVYYFHHFPGFRSVIL